jgi:3-hydroxyisobutyrate dehydrogenase
MPRIAVLGLGAMGSRMAARLIAAGHDVIVWNRSPGPAALLALSGASIASTPRAAAAGADIALSMVRDDDASRAVWLDPDMGALAALPAGAVAIESSTLAPDTARALAAAGAARGVPVLDAPVAGSRPQAEAGQLIFLVGGDAPTLDRVREVLLAMGGAVHHAGPAGAGMAIKLAVNAMLAVQVAALAELSGMLAAQGLDAARAADILGATPVASPAAKGALASMVAGAYAPNFPVALAEKDMGLVDAVARVSPVSHAARNVLRQAAEAGYGHEHLTAVRKLYAAG